MNISSVWSCTYTLEMCIAVLCQLSLYKSPLPGNREKHEEKNSQLGFKFITSLDVVLLMVEFHWKTRKYVTCVNNNLYQIHLHKYTPEKNSLWWIQQYLIFVLVSTYHPYKSWLFTYHMCAYLVQITVVNCDAQPSNNVNYFKMFYVDVIILRG